MLDIRPRSSVLPNSLLSFVKELSYNHIKCFDLCFGTGRSGRSVCTKVHSALNHTRVTSPQDFCE